MKERSISLRTLLSLAVAAMALLGLIVSGFLVLLTAQLARVSATLGDAVESVRIAEEAEIDLLLHARASDPDRRRVLENRIRAHLVESGRYVSSPEEARVRLEAVSAIEAYTSEPASTVTSTAGSAPLLRSYRAVARLVEINLEQAREARLRTMALGQTASGLGVAVGLIVIIVVGSVLVWLRTRAFAPVLALSDAMGRFERGDPDARAPVQGALELREMARRFNEMASAIARRRRQQMAFLAGVAHDLRNPIGALRFSTAAIPPHRPLPPEPILRRIVSVMDRQLELVERMLGDLLDTARLDAGQLELKIERCDLRPMVRHVVDLFRSTSPEDRFVLRLTDDEAAARCDPARMEQVLTNLVSNAIKYSPAGTPITIGLEAAGGELVLAVSDQGVGIAADDLRHLFEPFRRSGMSRESVPGVGLGLFVVRRIVRAHGGTIEVDSAPGRGSTFRVRLPRATSVADEALVESAAS